MVNINTGNIQNKQNVLWSRQLADKLDAADGQKDGKIDASVWNSYLTSMGSNGNKISNYITVDNASRSFDYYAAKKDAGNNSWKQWDETFDKYSGQEMLDKSQDTLKNLKNAKKEDVEVSDMTEQQKKYDSKAVTAKCYEFNGSTVVVSRDANGEINRIQVCNADSPDGVSDVSFRENGVLIDSDGDFSDKRQINKKQQNDLKSMLPDWIVNDTETSTPSSPKNVSEDEKQLSSQSSNTTSASLEAKIEKRREKLNKPVINSSSQTEVKNDSVGNQVQQASHSSVQSKPQNITSSEQVQAPKVTSKQNSEVKKEEVNTVENQKTNAQTTKHHENEELFYDHTNSAIYDKPENKALLGEYLPLITKEGNSQALTAKGWRKDHIAGALNNLLLLKPSHAIVSDNNIRIEKNNDNSITVIDSNDNPSTRITYNSDGSYRSGNVSITEEFDSLAKFVDNYLYETAFMHDYKVE